MKRLFSILAAVFLASPVVAETTEVDLELSLLVDVSRSMSQRELEIQRQGYAAALRSDVVFAAVQSGLLQRIALNYVEWAGVQRVVVDWTLIQSREDLHAFADAIEMTVTSGMRRTSISEALYFGAHSIASNEFEGLRKVIDISGDGPNNQGRPVLEARDDVTAQRIVINGLPLMTDEGLGNFWTIDDLDAYYTSCVIGGAGSFMLPVFDWTDFPDAVRRKLVMEIALRPEVETIRRVQYRQPEPYDCLIGEKMWRQWRMDMYNP